MNRLTQRALIVEVAERWRRQYQRADGWGTTVDGSSEPKYKALSALDPATATGEQVAAIIGNKSWSGYFCSECCEYTPETIEFENHGDGGCYVCPGCIRKAAALLELPSSGAENGIRK